MRTWLETDDGRVVEIRGTLTIGRASSSGYQVLQEDVSRRHALIHHQGISEHWLVHFGRNGTLLNGRRITQPIRLRNGDVIEIGKRRMTFRCETEGFSETVRTTTKATVSTVRVEQRILLLADICGFTRLSQSLPPDDLASLVGTWLAACRDLVHESGGSINKYLGDGFFATWPATDRVAAEFPRLRSHLTEVQHEAAAAFRFVVHVGATTVDSSMVDGEETLIGPMVNFVFRMEKIAAKHGMPRLWSREASEFLAGRMVFSRGIESEVSGFSGRHEFFVDE